jgi:hypothetical protein
MNLTERVTYSLSDNTVDSTVMAYDANGRMISSINYRNNAVATSNKWVYNEANKRIDHYAFMGVSDSLTHIIYKGVKNFDETNDFYSLFSFWGEIGGFGNIGGLGDVVAGENLSWDCDTVLVNMYDNTTSSWDVMVRMYLKYQNGKLASLKMVMEDFDISDFIGEGGEYGGMDITPTVNYTFIYSGDKLINANATLTVSISSIPVYIIPNMIVVTNQYNGNDLLVETKTEINITNPGTDDGMYIGLKQRYEYNHGNSVAVMIQEESNDGTSWELTGKTYYTYTGVGIKSINKEATVSLSQNIPNPANDNTLITYSIPANGKATFSIYSINGQLLSSQSVEAKTGENTLEVNTNNLSSGIYFYTMEFNGQRVVRKMNVNR